MIPFNRCPICGGEVASKEVEKILRGGNNAAIIKVHAEVCLHCGERMYSKEDIKHFENIRFKLAKQEVEDFKPVGRTYQVAG
jgi:YgiT-type zinc finger domain-containing protein